MLKIALMALVLLGAGCGLTDSSPDWEPVDAKAAMRDFIVDSVEIEDKRDRRLLSGIPDQALNWDAQYIGDGWWEVTGHPLGWVSYKVTTTPLPDTPTPTYTPTPVSMDILVAEQYAFIRLKVYRIKPFTREEAEQMVQRSLDKTPSPTSTPTPRPTPTPFAYDRWKYSDAGVWRVSERTGSIIADNDAATQMYRCLITTGAC